MGTSTMARGFKKHLKRLNAPKHWMLDKLSGVFAPRPTPGPHKLRECLPLCIFLRNRLHYALTYDEVKRITMQRLVKVDGKVRTDPTYPAGFMDVITLEKTGEHFRLIYDVKGRYKVHRISDAEAAYKLCKVKKVGTGRKGVPFLVTHDARTIRYPNPDNVLPLVSITSLFLESPVTISSLSPKETESSCPLHRREMLDSQRNKKQIIL